LKAGFHFEFALIINSLQTNFEPKEVTNGYNSRNYRTGS
jgi:hypothetical protein